MNSSRIHFQIFMRSSVTSEIQIDVSSGFTLSPWPTERHWRGFLSFACIHPFGLTECKRLSPSLCNGAPRVGVLQKTQRRVSGMPLSNWDFNAVCGGEIKPGVEGSLCRLSRGT